MRPHEQAIPLAIWHTTTDPGFKDLNLLDLAHPLRCMSARMAPPPIPGVTLGYLLGEGGTGKVYEAQRGTDALAVKVINPDMARTPGFSERFLHAAHALRELSHP